MRLTGDEEVAGSIPGFGNILSWRLIMKYFLGSFSAFADARRQLSVTGERLCTVLVNCLEGLSLPRKRVITLTDWLNMTEVLTGL